MNVKIYTKSTCPHCVTAKNTLKAEGVEFEEVNLEQNPGQVQPLIERTNYRKVPQIFINDNFIGGNSDLQQLIKTPRWEDLKNGTDRIA